MSIPNNRASTGQMDTQDIGPCCKRYAAPGEPWPPQWLATGLNWWLAATYRSAAASIPNNRAVMDQVDTQDIAPCCKRYATPVERWPPQRLANGANRSLPATYRSAAVSIPTPRTSTGQMDTQDMGPCCKRYAPPR